MFDQLIAAITPKSEEEKLKDGIISVVVQSFQVLAGELRSAEFKHGSAVLWASQDEYDEVLIRFGASGKYSMFESDKLVRIQANAEGYEIIVTLGNQRWKCKNITKEDTEELLDKMVDHAFEYFNRRYSLTLRR